VANLVLLQGAAQSSASPRSDLRTGTFYLHSVGWNAARVRNKLAKP